MCEHLLTGGLPTAATRICELGSGCGALGLALHFGNLGCEVTLTDLPQALPLLHLNACHNLERCREQRAASQHSQLHESSIQIGCQNNPAAALPAAAVPAAGLPAAGLPRILPLLWGDDDATAAVLSGSSGSSVAASAAAAGQSPRVGNTDSVSTAQREACEDAHAGEGAPGFDVIIGSDICYEPSSHAALLHTLGALAHGGGPSRPPAAVILAVGDWMQPGKEYSRYMAENLLKTGTDLGWGWEVKRTIIPGEYSLIGSLPDWAKVSDSSPMPVVILHGIPPRPHSVSGAA